MTSQFEMQVRIAQANVMRAQSQERDWAAFQEGRAAALRAGAEAEGRLAEERQHLLLQNP